MWGWPGLSHQCAVPVTPTQSHWRSWSHWASSWWLDTGARIAIVTAATSLCLWVLLTVAISVQVGWWQFQLTDILGGLENLIFSLVWDCVGRNIADIVHRAASVWAAWVGFSVYDCACTTSAPINLILSLTINNQETFRQKYS